MSASSENSIRSIIESQKQELMKLAEEINRLKKAYDAEKRERKLLKERCIELERQITGIHPAATSRSRDSEDMTPQLAYRQHREGLSSQQQNEYYDPEGYQDNADTQHQHQYDTTPYGYAPALPPQQYPAPYYPPSLPYQNGYAAPPQDRPGPEFPGGFYVNVPNATPHRSSTSSRRRTLG